MLLVGVDAGVLGTWARGNDYEWLRREMFESLYCAYLNGIIGLLTLEKQSASVCPGQAVILLPYGLKAFCQLPYINLFHAFTISSSLRP